MSRSKRNCCVVGCNNSGVKLREWMEKVCEVHECKFGGGKCVCDPPFQLFPFPSKIKKNEIRQRWIANVKRETKKNGKPWDPNYDSRVCSIHFVGGQPTSDDSYPTLKMGYFKKIKNARKPPKDRSAHPSTSNQNNHGCPQPDNSVPVGNEGTLTPPPAPEQEMVPDEEYCRPTATADPFCENNIAAAGTSAECEDCVAKESTIKKLKFTTGMLHKEVSKLKYKKVDYRFAFHSINTDSKAKFYTGFCGKVTMKKVIKQLAKKALTSNIRYWSGGSHKHKKRSFGTGNVRRKLTIEDEFVMTFMRLRLGLLITDLADRFHISPATVSRITTTLIKFIAGEMKSLIYSPPKEEINKSCLTKHFQTAPYSKVRHIVDCTEMFIETPKNLALQAATWSNYKHHNTMKYLVSVFPNGAFNFVSGGYGGRSSDKEIVMLSGFLNEVEPGDQVMADRGFLIREELLLLHADLLMPPGRRGQEQMTCTQVEKTKKIANRRIVVEQAIRRLKTFRILKYELSITSLSLLDEIVVICAAMCNLMVPIMQ